MKYFGTDGIRGVPNKKLTTELVVKLGKALKELNNNTVIIGSDTRLSKDMLKFGLVSGALSVGLNVIDMGVVPTPCLIYLSKVKGTIGIMITASHNPYTDNGIKVLKNGVKLSEEEENKVESLIDEYNANLDVEIGTYTYDDSLKNIYLDYIKSQTVKSDLKIALDLANGATYETAKEIFKGISSSLVIIGDKPDGKNINFGCGSTHLEQLKKVVVEEKCDIGFAFDGDGDRVLCINNDGSTVDGDQIIYILGRYLKTKGKLNNNKVVLTIMSNLGLISSLKENDIEVEETPVGDKYVVRSLFKDNLSLGGENSGHVILKDILETGDGVLVASQIIKVMEETNKTVSSYLDDVTMYADSLVNINVEDRNRVMNYAPLFEKIDSIKQELNNDCKIIVRPSGTEDLIRITMMAKDREIVKKYSEELVNLVKEA